MWSQGSSDTWSILTSSWCVYARYNNSILGYTILETKTRVYKEKDNVRVTSYAKKNKV